MMTYAEREEMLLRNEGLIRRMTERFSGSKPFRDDWDDALQTVRMHVWANVGKYREGAGMARSSFVGMLARQAAGRYRAWAGAKCRKFMQPTDPADLDGAYPGAEPRETDADVAWVALSVLPDHLFRALYGQFFDGLTLEGAGLLAGRSDSSIKRHRAEGLALCRKTLAGLGVAGCT